MAHVVFDVSTVETGIRQDESVLGWSGGAAWTMTRDEALPSFLTTAILAAHPLAWRRCFVTGAVRSTHVPPMAKTGAKRIAKHQMWCRVPENARIAGLCVVRLQHSKRRRRLTKINHEVSGTTTYPQGCVCKSRSLLVFPRLALGWKLLTPVA